MNTEIAVPQTQAVNPEVRKRSLMDISGVSVKNLILPRFQLLQSNSRAVQDDGQGLGTFSNSITKNNYGEVLSIMPLKITEGALYLTNEEGLICRSLDRVSNIHGGKCAQCPFNVHFDKWVDGKAPKCSKTIDILAIELTTFDLGIFTFRKSAVKVGETIVTDLALNEKYKKEDHCIRLGANKLKNEKGVFFVPRFINALPLSEEQYNRCSATAQNIQGKEITVDDSEMD